MAAPTCKTIDRLIRAEQKRLDHLLKTRTDVKKLFEIIRADQDSAYKKLKGIQFAVDLSATVLTGLFKMGQMAVKSLAKTGAKLAKANKEFLKTAAEWQLEVFEKIYDQATFDGNPTPDVGKNAVKDTLRMQGELVADVYTGGKLGAQSVRKAITPV